MNNKPTGTKRKNGHATHWWQTLMAVPQEKESIAYQRLMRVWFDHTRFFLGDRPDRTAEERINMQVHDFYHPEYETHLTLSLWENFSILEAERWVPALYELAGLPPPKSRIKKCNWSYEWVGYRPKGGGVNGRAQGMCDVVVAHEDEDGQRGVLVVEAKRLRAKLTNKELNFDYYLMIDEIAEFGMNASLVFLLDETVREKSLAMLRDRSSNIGLITWQQLAGLQVELVQNLEATIPIRNFVAGAIQFQFAQHDIRPVSLSNSYLEEEMSMTEIDALPKLEKQSMADHRAMLWRL